MRVWAAFGFAVVALAGCTKKAPEGPGPIRALDTEVRGLSGLSRDEHGALWAPGEDGDAVLRIDPGTGGTTEYLVSGLPDGVDLEALTWVDGTRFIVGTETQESGRTSDALLEGRLSKDRFVLSPLGQLDYSRWGLTARDNHGIEGICHVDGVWVVATELIDEQRGRRWAPLGMYEPNTQTWTAHRVGLSSDSGKLSAIDCREVDGRIEALAIERHYGVSRLLRFTVPRGPQPQWIEPSVALDLSTVVSPLPNFEGLAWMPDGSVYLLTDNQYRGRAPDPSRLYFVPASAVR